MKTLTSILVLLFSTTVFAEDMIPLGKYLDQNKFEENEMFYVFSRCSAINYKMMDLSKNITIINMPNVQVFIIFGKGTPFSFYSI